MVKIWGVLRVLLLLFVPTHGHFEVSISCTTLWLEVKVRQSPLVNNLPLQPNELFLGEGCPINLFEDDFYVFFYILTLCGIQVHMYPLSILIETSLTYEPTQFNLTGHIPITCYIQRKFPINFVMKRNEENEREPNRPVGQTYSLASEPAYMGSLLELLPQKDYLESVP